MITSDMLPSADTIKKYCVITKLLPEVSKEPRKSKKPLPEVSKESKKPRQNRTLYTQLLFSDDPIKYRKEYHRNYRVARKLYFQNYLKEYRKKNYQALIEYSRFYYKNKSKNVIV